MGRRPREKVSVVQELFEVGDYYVFNGNVIKEKDNITPLFNKNSNIKLYASKKLIAVKQIEKVCTVIVPNTKSLLSLMPLRKKYEGVIDISIQIYRRG